MTRIGWLFFTLCFIIKTIYALSLLVRKMFFTPSTLLNEITIWSLHMHTVFRRKDARFAKPILYVIFKVDFSFIKKSPPPKNHPIRFSKRWSPHIKIVIKAIAEKDLKKSKYYFPHNSPHNKMKNYAMPDENR